MDNFWRNLLWIMAFFSVLFGFGLMTLSVVGGWVTLAGAVLLTPPASSWVGSLIGPQWAPPILGFIVAMFAGPIVALNTAPSAEEVQAIFNQPGTESR